MDDEKSTDSGSCILVEDGSSDVVIVSQDSSVLSSVSTLDPLSSSVSSSDGHGAWVLSDEMIKEEELLRKETFAEEAETQRLNEERLQSLEKDECYERLKFLLTNCVHYTKHLHRRMEEQQLELAKAIEKQRAEKSEKDNERKAKIAASRLNKKKVGLNDGSGSNTGSPLQEKFQRTSARVRSQLAVSTDDNNNFDSNKRGKARTQLRQPRKRTKLSVDSEPVAGDNYNENADAESQAECVEKPEPDADECSADRTDSIQPILFTGGTLRQYQIEGFKWLQMLYENAINGILADEMGLGKTVQCIALICELIENGLDGPFLICGPLSTLPNWISEFAHFAPKVPSILYHGSKVDRLGLLSRIRQLHKVDGGRRSSVHPVVITSFEIAMKDSKFLAKFPWKLMIVDEGHRIKNSQCRLVKELKTYNSTHRLLLTGTPLQNNMAELWSLLNFLIPEIFDSLGSFETWFDAEFLETVDNAHEQIIQEEQRKHTLSMLHQILKPFMLRRLKSDVELVIPPKRELLVYARLVAEQQEMYRSIVDKTIRRLVEGPSLEEQSENAERDKKGRPVRKARKNAANLKFMLENEDTEDDSSATTPGKKKNSRKRKYSEVEDDDLENWAENVTKYHQQIDSAKKKRDEVKPKVFVDVQLRNLVALLRRCCNHPFLIEQPMEDGVPTLDETIVTSCGKMMLLDRMLQELVKTGHKVLIFSQMTMMLDILEDYLCFRGYKYSRLDGTMNVTKRQEQMKHFADNLDVTVFLISTRAGGLGINLTQADTVIIYDSDWNPQHDLQAQDRCHRIGQVRPVMVYRLVTANTVDQRIVERATAKRKLEKLVIQKGKFKFSKVLGLESLPLSSQELLELLKERDYTEVAKEKMDHVISDRDLQQLLDRSDLQAIWNRRLDGKTDSKPSASDLELKGVFKVVTDVYDEPEVKSVGIVAQERDDAS